MNTQLLTADEIFDGQRCLSHAVIAIDDTGTIQQLITQPDRATRRRAIYYPGLLCPGFVNAHCHTELSYLKGLIPRGTGLVEFILQLMHLRQQSFFTEGIKQQAIIEADQQMQHEGIVAVGDIVNTTDSLPIKTQTSLYYHHFVECMGVPDHLAYLRWQQAQALAQIFLHETHFPASLTPHAPYSVSDALLAKINDMHQPLLSIHNQESAAENEWFLSGTGHMQHLFDSLKLPEHTGKASGLTSLQYVLPKIDTHSQLILVHNTFITEADIVQAGQREAPVYWCLCPKANMYIENQLPPLPLLMSHTDRMVIGTDSLASNDTLSIVEELKCLQKHFSFLSLETLLRWATWNGAHALQLANRLGSFQPGKQPGVVQIFPIQGKQLLSSSTAQRIC
ncbi:MAG: amidohydrolase family protein [Thermoflavifilum sp.]|nr:amidohydrolase family protein [Thermoflavifilum sp.]